MARLQACNYILQAQGGVLFGRSRWVLGRKRREVHAMTKQLVNTEQTTTEREGYDSVTGGAVTRWQITRPPNSPH